LSGLRLQGAHADRACLYVYDCKRCQHRMKAIKGKCGGCRWVFCSYGSTPCPPAQCRPGSAAPDSVSPDIAAVAAPDYSLKIWRLLRRAPAPLASMRLLTVEAFFRDALAHSTWRVVHWSHAELRRAHLLEYAVAGVDPCDQEEGLHAGILRRIGKPRCQIPELGNALGLLRSIIRGPCPLSQFDNRMLGTPSRAVSFTTSCMAAESSGSDFAALNASIMRSTRADCCLNLQTSASVVLASSNARDTWPDAVGLASPLEALCAPSAAHGSDISCAVSSPLTLLTSLRPSPTSALRETPIGLLHFTSRGDRVGANTTEWT
jgi:hypothetical protein